MRKQPTPIALLLAVLALGVPATASADMQLGLQNDEAWKYHEADGALQFGPSDETIARAAYVGANTIRLMAQDNRWADEADTIVNAAARAKAEGKYVIVSLHAQKSHPTPAEWAPFTASVVSRMGPYVDAWSPMNEPTYPGFAAYTATRCTTSKPPSTGKKSTRRVRGWKRVRRGRGTHRRTITQTRHKIIVKFKRAHGKRARWKRAKRGARTRIVYVKGWRRERACATDSMVRGYRNIWERVTPIIQQFDPTAGLILGDIYTDPVDFMRLFYENGKPDVRPDVLGTHYSCPCAMDGFVDAAKRRGLQLWETEWGLGQWGDDPSPRDWVRVLRAFDRAGVGLTVVYDVANSTWDTRMSDQDLGAVADR